MKKQCLSVGLALGVAGFLGAGDAVAKDMSGWEVRGIGAGIVGGLNYNLFNSDQGAYIRYGDRWGFNAKWEAPANERMSIKRKGSVKGHLTCGEVFALFIEKEWIIHEAQDFGINLSSRKLLTDAGYQWKFTCPEGETVPLNGSVALTNTITNDSVVGCKRTKGVNLCWAEDVRTVRGKNYRKADLGL